MILACLLAAGMLAPQVVQAASGTSESVLVTYDLRSILPAWDDGDWAQTLLFPPAAHPELDSAWAEPDLAELAPFELLDLLSQLLGDELRREGREVVAEGSELTVLAPEPVQRQVKAVLESLRASMGAAVQLRVDVLTSSEAGASGLPSSVLSEAEAAKLIATLLERGAVHQSFETDLTVGRTAWLDARRRIPFVFDYDVEIACTSLVFDAVTSATYEGTRIGLRALPLGEGLGLALVVMRSELLGPIESKPLGLKGMVARSPGPQPEAGSVDLVSGPAQLQSPRVLERALGLNLGLPEGQALALSFDVDLEGTRRREVIVVRRGGGSLSPYLAQKIPGTNRTLIALDSELFRPTRLRAVTSPDEDSYLLRSRGGFATPWVEARLKGEPPSYLIEWLKLRFSVWRRFGPWILLVTDPAWDREAASELERLVKGLRDQPRLRDVALDFTSGGPQGAHPVRVRFPMLDGSEAGIAVGRGSTVLSDYDVEVAQGAAVPDPIVECLFEGLALRLVLQGGSCEARGMAQRLEGLATFDPDYDMVGRLELPEAHVLRLEERRDLGSGPLGRALFGSRSERPEQAGLALEMVVSTPAVPGR